jgi:hypothetical protein|tara:strand:- start:4817 stop:5059 length:243 start_codon:yes stop_codon:yes gene_type:complete
VAVNTKPETKMSLRVVLVNGNIREKHMTSELMVVLIVIAGTYIAARIAGMNKSSSLDKGLTKEEKKTRVQAAEAFGRKHH